MKRNGFSLIELMVALGLVAILSAIVYPSYISHIQKTRRADGKAALMAISQQLERYYTERNTYATATLGANGLYASTSANGYYTLTLPSATLTASTYVIRAAPTGAQSTDACGTLTLDEQGNQGVSGGTITDATQCW